jgi:Fe-S oxidoreductase
MPAEGKRRARVGLMIGCAADAFFPQTTMATIRVLHEAVTLAGIAVMGPILPQLSNIGAAHTGAIRAAAQALLAHDKGLQ